MGVNIQFCHVCPSWENNLISLQFYWTAGMNVPLFSSYDWFWLNCLACTLFQSGNSVFIHIRRGLVCEVSVALKSPGWLCGLWMVWGAGWPGSAGLWHSEQLTWLHCQREGPSDASALPELESKVDFVIFVSTASHKNGSCEIKGIALISVSSCWGYWESIFCFGNIMFGFPKQNFTGFLFHENFNCWLTSWFKSGFFFLGSTKKKNIIKNQISRQPCLGFSWKIILGFFYMLLVRNFIISMLFAFVFLSSLLVFQCAA